jgi:heme exporter protein B
MRTFIWQFKNEIRLLSRNSAGIIQPLFFFVLLASLFPLSLPANQQAVLVSVAPAIIWVTAILSLLLSLENLFKSDYLDGTLEQYILSAPSLLAVILAKVMSHWVMSGLLISLIAPVIAYAMSLNEVQILALFVSLLIGTLTITLIGAFASALTLAARQSGMLIALLVLPLYIPVLIFATGLVEESTDLASVLGPIYMLLAILVLALTFIPITISMVFKHVLD